MNRRELRKQIIDGITNAVQSKVYGTVYIEDDLICDTYILCITDGDIRFMIDIGDSIYSIENDLISNNISALTNFIELANEIFEIYQSEILKKYTI